MVQTPTRRKTLTLNTILKQAFNAEAERHSFLVFVTTEVSGRRLSQIDNNFDWDEHKAKIEAATQDMSADEIVAELIASVYWYTCEGDIVKAGFEYRTQAREGFNRKAIHDARSNQP
ncbi:hypothetical protein [Leptolyngbya sp. AN10]|uniref:hypothetical protein n=1 Tax=Leptolyngbya sp. AN10 TaxID=3423365 RepID=UPI003D31B366